MRRVRLGTLALCLLRPEDGFRLLDAFVEAGGRELDTAALYGGGYAEAVVGAWLRRVGRVVRITTKVGHFDRPEHFTDAGRVRAAVRASVDRLGAVPDEVLLHEADWACWWDRDAPAGALGAPPAGHAVPGWRVLDDLGRELGFRPGLSGNDAHVLGAVATRLAARHVLVAKQYDLLWRSAEELLARPDLAVGVAAPFHQARLFDLPRLAADARAAGDPALAAAADALADLLARWHTRVAEVAVPFVLADPRVAHVCAGVEDPAQLRSLADAADRHLDPDLLAALRSGGVDRPARPGPALGARYRDPPWPPPPLGAEPHPEPEHSEDHTMRMPYLKPACQVSSGPADALTVTYHGRGYQIPTADPAAARAAVEAMDGRRAVERVAGSGGLAADELDGLLARLAELGLVVDAADWVRADGQLSGQEAYWRLEGQLWHWRGLGQRPDARPVTRLEVEVGAGKAPVEVVKGFCLEICHQVSNAPTEIALAVANAPTKAVRDLYMEFYEEEHAHGDMLREALAEWIPATGIDAAVPLPETAGLLHTYDWWAQSDPLLYAVALMRDEGSPLDAPAAPEHDVYQAMERHYDVPAATLERFRWHANLDCDLDHGSFPLEVFSQFPTVEPRRYARLCKAARTISELYDAMMAAILEVYSAQPVESRWSQETVDALAR